MMRDVAAPEMDLPDDALEDGSLSTYLSFMAPEQYPSFRQHSAADDEVESVSQKGMISEHQPPYPPSGVEAGFLILPHVLVGPRLSCWMSPTRNLMRAWSQS